MNAILLKIMLKLRSDLYLKEAFKKLELNLEIAMLILRLQVLRGDITCNQYDKSFTKKDIRKMRQEIRIVSKEIKRRNS